MLINLDHVTLIKCSSKTYFSGLFSPNLVLFLKLRTQGGMHMHQHAFYNAGKGIFDQTGVELEWKACVIFGKNNTWSTMTSLF